MIIRYFNLIILFIFSLFVLAYSSEGDDNKASSLVGNLSQNVESSNVIKDNCVPNCKDRQCGDDGCEGECGFCGDNAMCVNFKCICNTGYMDCDNNMSNGCEKKISDEKNIWSKRFGGSGHDVGKSVSVDSSGNVYITGGFDSSTIDFGGGALKNAGGDDIFLAKLDNKGNHIWSKRFGGSGHDVGKSVSVDSSGNVYITGGFNSSTINFGGGILTNAGGECNSSICSDIFLAKFDNKGNHIWSKRFGGSGRDVGNSVSVDSSGNVYITGGFNSSTIDFGGGALTNAGGTCEEPIHPCVDIFLAKFDSKGNHL